MISQWSSTNDIVVIFTAVSMLLIGVALLVYISYLLHMIHDRLSEIAGKVGVDTKIKGVNDSHWIDPYTEAWEGDPPEKRKEVLK